MADTPYLDYNKTPALRYDVTSGISSQISSLERELEETAPEEKYEDSSEAKYLDFVRVLGDNKKIDEEIDAVKDEINKLGREKYDYKRDPRYKDLMKSAKQYRKDLNANYNGMYAYEDSNRSSSTAITNLIGEDISLSKSIDEYITKLKNEREQNRQERINQLKDYIKTLKKGYKTASLKSDLSDIKINATDDAIYNEYFGTNK